MSSSTLVAGVKGAGADVTSQLVLQREDTYDPGRTVAFGIWSGTYCGCVLHLIYNRFFPKVFPITTAGGAAHPLRRRHIVAMVCFDNFLSSPWFFMPSYYILREALRSAGTERGPALVVRTALETYHQEFWSCMGEGAAHPPRQPHLASCACGADERAPCSTIGRPHVGNVGAHSLRHLRRHHPAAPARALHGRVLVLHADDDEQTAGLAREAAAARTLVKCGLCRPPAASDAGSTPHTRGSGAVKMLTTPVSLLVPRFASTALFSPVRARYPKPRCGWPGW